MPQTEYTEAEERIFEAALQAFARKGKEGARMQEIADAAQINKAMLHYYFRSKDRLYAAVFEYVFRRFFAGIGEAVAEAETFEAVLRTFITGYIDFLKDHQDVVRLMVNENLSGGEAVVQQVNKLKAADGNPVRALIGRIAQAAKSGEIRPIDPFQTALTVLASCIFFFIVYPIMREMNPGVARDRDGFLEERKRHLVDLLYHGLQPRPPDQP